MSELEYIKRIKELREVENLTWTQIAAKLNEEGIKTPRGNAWSRENAFRQYQHKVKGIK